jgi:glutamate-ammonia-ligase adenylyltransferase
MENAWTWEQQALIRARFVAGDPQIAENFTTIRRHSLCRAREESLLRQQVLEMRDKMRINLESINPGRFDLKLARGGIVDIEFIVQFGVLNGAHKHPNLAQWTDVLRLVDSLRDTCFLNSDQACVLKEAYCLFRKETHRSALLEQSATAPEEDFVEIRSKVQAIWLAKFGRF